MRNNSAELLSESNKRATIVAMQANQNNTTYSVDEFTNPPEFLFGAAPWGDKQFKISLTKTDESPIDSSICQQMKDIAGNSSPIRQINPDCSRIIYNNDLSTTSETDVGNCGNGGIYLSFRANPCGYASPPDEEAFACKKNSDCIGQQVEGTICSANTCYCNVLGASGNLLSSSCALLTDGEEVPAADTQLGTVLIKEKSLLRGGPQGSFVSAENWCQAHGRRMVYLSDLDIKTPEGNSCTKSSSPPCLNMAGDPVDDTHRANLKSAITGGMNTWTRSSYGTAQKFFITGAAHLSAGIALAENTRNSYVICK